jgi:hypothetical protein
VKRFVIVLVDGHEGYLKSFDPEAFGGRGQATWTSNLADAMQFQTFAEAFSFWKMQSRTKPLREDGEVNRPLTAFTVEIRGILSNEAEQSENPVSNDGND